MFIILLTSLEVLHLAVINVWNDNPVLRFPGQNTWIFHSWHQKMFPKVVDFITNQDTETQKTFERENQNSERSVTLILVTDNVTLSK